MQKCTTCQYYDRKHAKAAAGSMAQSQQGQCRRMAPMLHPINPKSYLIEGVWPTVHDDDWCGEWKLVARRAETRVSELSSATALAGVQPKVPHVARIGANSGAEPVSNAKVSPLFTSSVEPLMPIADRPAIGVPLAAAELTMGTRSGDD